jgi:hypothetical protein
MEKALSTSNKTPNTVLMPLTGSKNRFFAPNGSRMERVNGNLADFIPRFGLEVAYTHAQLGNVLQL